jgi:hypothetical protein
MLITALKTPLLEAVHRLPLSAAHNHFKTSFNIDLPSMPRSHKGYIPSVSSDHDFLCISIICHTCLLSLLSFLALVKTSRSTGQLEARFRAEACHCLLSRVYQLAPDGKHATGMVEYVQM